MELIIGGYAQGKRAFVEAKYQGDTLLIMQGETLANTHPKLPEVGLGKRLVIDGVHLFFKTLLLEGKEPESYLDQLMEVYSDCIFISDEIGNGIVPMDPFERAYRERTGRYLIELAKKANGVERVLCGIGQKIK